MQAVILAAGVGSRFVPKTLTTPKPLISIHGIPLIYYPIMSLIKSGIDELILVVGYLGNILIKEIKKLELEDVKMQFVFNEYFTRGNGISLCMTKRHIKDDRFLLVMGDHILHPCILQALLDSEAFSMGIDTMPMSHINIEEATKVKISKKGDVRNVGKDLPRFNGVDVGAMLCNKKVFDACVNLASTSYHVTVTDCLNWLIKNRVKIKAVDVKGLFWADVDSEQDRAYMETIMPKNWLDSFEQTLGRDSIA